jgi:linoleoyl-CoA desaturase
MHKQLNPEQFLDALQRYLRKAIPNFAWNYGLFGLLAGPLFWGKVTLGTLTAALLRNIFTGFSFYTGHMVENAKHYQAAPRNRAEWYIQQIEGTANVEGSRLLSLLMGHLNYQIEHHLFPKLPPNRLEQIAPRVRELCETYGVRYNTGSFGQQMGSVFRRAFKFAR